jgi:pimeloyl-ACP methyl ester carboxylesterase
MGVQVALEYYRHYPEAVSHLILMCGSYGEPLKTFHGSDKWESFLPVVRSAVEWAPRFTRKLISRVLPTQFFFRIAKAAEIHPKRVKREDFFPYLEHASQLNPELVLDMLAHAGEHSAKDLLGEIAVPTLVISGGNDGFTPASLSQEMFELIDDAELLLLPEGTHAAPIEFPQEINQRIEALLSRRVFSLENDVLSPVTL